MKHRNADRRILEAEMLGREHALIFFKGLYFRLCNNVSLDIRKHFDDGEHPTWRKMYGRVARRCGIYFLLVMKKLTGVFRITCPGEEGILG